MIGKINRVLRGFFVYFRESVKASLAEIDGWIRGWLRSMLRKRQKLHERAALTILAGPTPSSVRTGSSR